MSEGKAGSRVRMDYDSALPHMRRAAQGRGGKRRAPCVGIHCGVRLQLGSENPESVIKHHSL